MVSVNEDAPVMAKAEIEIEADPVTVWKVITDIESWPDWNPDVESAIIHGELEKGTQFQWKSGPWRITSILQEVDPPHQIAWTGKTMGVNAIHVWRLEDKNNITLAQSEESWDGLVSRDMHDRMQEMLESSLKSVLKYLKDEVESL